MCNKCMIKPKKAEPKPKKKSQCPTHAPGQNSNAVAIEEQCGVELITLFDTIAVPREFVAAVTLRTTMAPNAAPNWSGHTSVKDCEQLFFFDTRRSVRELEATISACMFLNHSLNHHGLPTYERTAPRATARQVCQCRHNDCPASLQRIETLHKTMPYGAVTRFYQSSPASVARLLKSGAVAAETMPMCGLQNTCWLTAGEYDSELSDQLSLDKGKQVYNSDLLWRNIRKESSAGALRRWHVYDAATETPLLPFSNDSVEAEKWSGADGNGTLSFEKSVNEAAALCSCSSDGQFTPSTITMCDLVAGEVLDCRARSAHSAPLCWHNSAAIAERLLVSGYSLDQVLKNRQGDDLTSKETVHECAGDLLERMHSFDASERQSTHKYGCNCLIESFLERKCSKRLDFVLVTTPVNPLHRDLGDSLLAIESPLMCQMMTMGVTIKLGAVESLNITALPGEEKSYTQVIARQPEVRFEIKQSAGPFNYTVDSHGHASNFRSTDTQQPQHAFIRQVERELDSAQRKGALPHGKIVAQWPAGISSYGALLRESKRAFGAPDSVESLVELALHRGKLRDGDMLARRLDWMPLALVFMLAHAIDKENVIESFARQVLAEPKNNNRIYTTSCEHMIFNELMQTRNWRLATARASTVLIIDSDTLMQYRRNVVYGVCLIALMDQIVELAEFLRAEQEQKKQQCAVVVPKVPRKKKERAKKVPKDPYPDLPQESRLRQWIVVV